MTVFLQVFIRNRTNLKHAEIKTKKIGYLYELRVTNHIALNKYKFY